MKIIPHKRDEWDLVAKAAHAEVFEDRDFLPVSSQYHTSLVAATDSDQIIGYALIADCLTGYYIEYGGATKEFKNSVKVLPALKAIIDYLKATEVPFFTTHISNKNIRMIKLYLKIGFIITGMSTWKEETMLELTFDNLIKKEV